jgi:MATE family multidrug resistance protein
MILLFRFLKVEFSNSPALVGLYTQRAIIICLLSCIPILGLWAISGLALRLIGVPDSTSEIAFVLILWRMPGLPAQAIFECLRRFVHAQNVAWPVTLSCGIVCVVHVIITWFLVQCLGYRGASLAISVSQWGLVIVLLVLILLRERFLGATSTSFRNSWPKLSRDVFAGWSQYLRYASPAMLSLFVEWGGYELYAALCARVGTTALVRERDNNDIFTKKTYKQRFSGNCEHYEYDHCLVVYDSVGV